MSQFNVHQPEQNSKRELVEAFKESHTLCVKLQKRITELEKDRTIRDFEQNALGVWHVIQDMKVPSAELTIDEVEEIHQWFISKAKQLKGGDV